MFVRQQIEDSGISKKIGTENKNVILIFAEGTSSYCLSPELTPNVMDLKKESIAFENYFSHTAATFRGIRGQMISGFPLFGGTESYEMVKKYYSGQFPSLPEMLNRYGYKTIFVSPHAPNENLGNVMGLLGFKYLKHSLDYKDSENLSDREQYLHLWQILEGLSKTKEKFFLATYVLGTHHGMDSPDKKYGNGKNSYLNKFHNQDYWFGEFLKKFKASGLSKNTVLIWTSDHSTYPTNEYNDTFRRKEEHFVGKIPLIIYNNGKNAKLIDAKIRNSLSLAPTILDMLNIHEEKNYFLGNSLFIDKKNEWDNIAVIGPRRVFYVKENGEVCFLKDISRLKNRILRNRMTEYYKFIQ